MMKKIYYASPVMKVFSVHPKTSCLQSSVNSSTSTEGFTNGDTSDLGEDWD